MGAKQKPITKEIPRGMRGKQVTGGWGGGGLSEGRWMEYFHTLRKKKKTAPSDPSVFVIICKCVVLTILSVLLGKINSLDNHDSCFV